VVLLGNKVSGVGSTKLRGHRKRTVGKGGKRGCLKPEAWKADECREKTQGKDRKGRLRRAGASSAITREVKSIEGPNWGLTQKKGDVKKTARVEGREKTGCWKGEKKSEKCLLK